MNAMDAWADSPKLNPKIQAYIDSRTQEFDQIPAERLKPLAAVAEYVRDQIVAGKESHLIFICTHNSRRSHFAQVWAQVAADYNSISGVHCYSGGTQVTACNPRTVAALQRAGIQSVPRNETKDANPKYRIRWNDGANHLVLYSKRFDESSNPHKHFAAVMTCSDADQECPVIPGCSLRVSLPYDDPKLSDNSPIEIQTYDLRCQQIAREMLFVFSRIN